MRFTSNGVCIACNDENNANRWKGERGAWRKAQQELLDKGGARSAEEAKAHGLKWFAKRTRCGHDVVFLDGFTCLTCGDKEQLDLDHPLLS